MKEKPVAKIGFAAPFTGDQSIVGIPMRQCAELAVTQANEQGNLPFHLILQGEDDRADPTEVEAVAHRFVADSTVIGVVGHKNSGPSAAAAPIYDAAGLVQLSPSSTNPQLGQQGYRTFFRMCAHDMMQGKVAAEYAIRALGARRIVIIHDQTDYGQPLAEVVQVTTQAEGAEVVLFEGITEGETDFSATVDRIQKLTPDLVYFALTEIESSILTRQLRAAVIETNLFGTDGSRESQFLPLAGAAAEGVYQTYAGIDPQSTPAARPFVEAFEAAYGPVPVYGAEVYDATNLLIDALRRTGQLDRRQILRSVAEMKDFKGIAGQIRFESNGDRHNPQVSIWQVVRGEMHMLGLAQDLIPDKEKR